MSNISAGTPAREALTNDILKDARISDDATLQERVIASDISRASDLMSKIELIIDSGEENHVNRKGAAQIVPLRVDSASKLLHCWIALANVRAVRCGVATSIRETREASETRQSVSVQAVMNDPAAMAAAMTLTNALFGTKRLENQE
jgi:hypothetical protein